MSGKKKVDRYDLYFDQEKPLRQIHGMIAELNRRDADGGENVAVFRCDGGFLVVQVDWDYYDWPERGSTTQTFCETRRRVADAIPRDFYVVLADCRKRKWQVVDKIERSSWRSDTTGSTLHVYDYGAALCGADVQFVPLSLWSNVKSILLRRLHKCKVCEDRFAFIQGTRPRAEPLPAAPVPATAPKTWQPPMQEQT